jgi:hypothetical protein
VQKAKEERDKVLFVVSVNVFFSKIPPRKKSVCKHFVDIKFVASLCTEKETNLKVKAQQLKRVLASLCS